MVDGLQASLSMDVGGWGLQVKRALERQVLGMGFPVVGHDAGDEGGDGQEAGGEQQGGSGGGPASSV